MDHSFQILFRVDRPPGCRVGGGPSHRTKEITAKQNPKKTKNQSTISMMQVAPNIRA
jgi:hypothetical protein